MCRARYRAIDIANWFLTYNESLRDMENEDTDDISNLKLQKLLYYAQGCFLAIKNEPLFSDDIVAWAHGPVVEEVYHTFKDFGSGGITQHEESSVSDSDTINLLVSVYDVFGKYSAWGLRNLTHSESPWLETPRNEIISLNLISDYFKSHYIEES